MGAMQGYFVKKIGKNKGKPRIWLENLQVSAANLAPGDSYDVQIKGGTVTLRADPNGARVVSSKTDKRTGKVNPVIDINSEKLLSLFDGMSAIRIVQREGEIYLLPLASELRKKERLTRLRNKVLNGHALDVGSMSHGGGLLAHAVHEGLEKAGLKARSAMANEIRPELLDHSSDHSGVWDSGTIPFGAPMQELAFDEAAMRHIPKLDLMEAGLPCSGASVAGRAKRGTAHPEEHPEVGHLVVAALVIVAKANPAAFLLENVVPYSSSASASILRNQLRDMGYVTHETTLKGESFNALEHRNRWCMVAVTEGMHFDWDMLQLPEKRDLTLSEILDDIPEDHPSWSHMTGLKAKEVRDKAAGKGFMMQIVDGQSNRIGTLGKGLAKNRSTEPKIRHPTNPDLLRIPTASEHAKVKQFPPGIVEGLSATIAHEVLGQSVIKDPFVEAARLIGESFKDYAFDNKSDLVIKAEEALRSVIEDELNDIAHQVVSELRAPASGVTYEGVVTAADMGVVIQDIGNGVGIIHRDYKIGGAKLGEPLQIKYPKPGSKEGISVTSLAQPAPAQTEELQHVIETQQQGMFDSPSPQSAPRGPR